MPFLQMIQAEQIAQRSKAPALYEVVLMSDETTPMEFVMVILQNIFHQQEDVAVDTTMETFREGQASCGVFTRDIAETKMTEVIDMARANHFPLKCIMHRH